ncbi:MAG: helicase-associated domain-containing protein [Planctomycetota bacterium]|nr:helicase-associated domain-containing protein [Planctomycetota bacterium]
MRYYRSDEPKPATIAEALRAYGNDNLTPMVRQFCEGKPATRKEDMISRLLSLLEGDNLRGTFAKLEEREQAALAETVWSDDASFNKARFEAKYGRRPLPKADPDDAGLSYMHSRQRSVTLLELFMPQDSVPRDLQLRLRQFVPRPAAAKINTIQSPPEDVEIPTSVWNEKQKKYDRVTEAVLLIRRDMERAALHDVLAVLRLVDAGKVAITDKNRWPTPSSLKQIMAVLDGGDFYPDENADADKNKQPWEVEDKPGPIRAFAWPLLLQAGKLAQVRGTRLELTKAGKTALAAPAHETLAGLWEDWLFGDVLDELRRVNVIRGQTGKGHRYLTDPTERREAIAAALSECPVAQWIALDEFSRYARAAGHEFGISDDLWTLYIAEQQYGSLGYDGCSGWNILQFRYLLCLLMEYAATLGLIDVAFIRPAGARRDYGDMWGTDDLDFFSRYDGLFYMRLNALGAFCLGLRETYAPPPPEARQILNVLANLDVVATAPLSPADRMLLEAFAERTGDHVWRLHRDRILSGVAKGRNIQELIVFLESSAGTAMPQPVVQFFADVQKRAIALSDLGAARLIRCVDSALAALIANDSAAGRCCSLVGGDMIVVPAKDEAAFHRAIRKLGYVLSRPSAGS